MMTTRRSKLTDLDRVALSDEDTEGRLEDERDGLREDEGSEDRRLEDAAEEDVEDEATGEEGGPGRTPAGDEYDRLSADHGIPDASELVEAKLEDKLERDVAEVDTRFRVP